MSQIVQRFGAWNEIEKLEYYIRRYQNSIVVIQRTNYIPSSAVGFKSALPGAEAKQEDILRHAKKIVPLKKRLYELTGRCSPLSPKWPR